MVAERGRDWTIAGLALFLGAVLRAYFVLHANPLSGDPQLYGSIARNLLEHHVYSFSNGSVPITPTLIRLPGYPFFLAACFALFGMGNFTAVLWVQVALDLLACVMLAGLARSLFGVRAGRLCLLLSCLCPFTANYTATPLTETLTLASITAAFYSLDRWRRKQQPLNRWLAAIGSSLATSLLLRPEQVLLSVAVLPAMLRLGLRHRLAGGVRPRWIRAGAAVVVAALCAVLPLMPWTARNWRVFHVVEPLAPRQAVDPGEPVPLGFERWYRTWAIDFASTEEVYWNYDGSPINIDDLPERAFDTPMQRAATAELLRDYNETLDPTPELNARFAELAEQRIASSPLRYYVLLPAARLVNMLLRPRTELTGLQLAWWRWRESRSQAATAAAMAALNLLYLALGIHGWRRWRRHADSEEHVLLLSTAAFVLLRCALLLTLDNSEPRYTLEFFPILILWGSAHWAERFESGDVSVSSSRRS